MKIRYLGKQPAHRDRWFYADVTWAPGEVQEVDDEIGAKLVATWPELYAVAEGESANAPAPLGPSTADGAMTDKKLVPERRPIDLDKATRGEMADYAEVHFGASLNRNDPRPKLRKELFALLQAQ